MKKGFTLVELLGVIIIITALTLIALPKITNLVKNSSDKTDKLTEEMISSAANLYVSENESKFDKINGNSYCISLRTLVDSGYLKGPITTSKNNQDITDSKSIQVSYNGDYTYEVMDKNNCKEVMSPEYILQRNGYQILDYIESTGTQWIDTGLYGGLDTYGIEIKLQAKEVQNGYYQLGNFNQVGQCGIMTGTVSDSYNKVRLIAYVGTETNRFELGLVDEELTISNKDRVITSNGITVGILPDNTKKLTNSKLQFFHAGTGQDFPGQGRIYYVKLYNDLSFTTKIMELIPCYEKANPTNVGMYDTVSNKFYGNAGSGTFEKGEDVN